MAVSKQESVRCEQEPRTGCARRGHAPDRGPRYEQPLDLFSCWHELRLANKHPAERHQKPSLVQWPGFSESGDETEKRLTAYWGLGCRCPRSLLRFRRRPLLIWGAVRGLDDDPNRVASGSTSREAEPRQNSAAALVQKPSVTSVPASRTGTME